MAAKSVGPVAFGDTRKKNPQIYRVIAGFGIFYVCLTTFSIQFESVKPGLDASWAWALNAGTQTTYIFGRDVVFTYGPLGFLMCPRPIAHNFQWASGFAVCIQAIYAALLGVIAVTARTKRGFLLFLAGSVVASAFGMWDEYSYRILMGLCLLVASLSSPFALPACIVAGVLAPVFLMMKFAIGLTSLSMMAVVTMVLTFRQKAWRKIFALWFSAAVSLTFWVLLLFRNIRNFTRWLALSWELASGYGSAMSFPGPAKEAVVGILLLAALLLSGVLLKGIARTPSLIFAVPGVMALKHGFVGHTGMSTGYFIFMVVVASVIFLFVETRAEWLLSGLFWTLTCAAAVGKGIFLIAWPPITLEELRRHLSGQVGIQALRNVWDSKKLALDLQADSSRNLAEERLSARWNAELRGIKGGIDVFPWELTYLPANDLPWRPSIVLQQYAAYTHPLDEAMAERLRSLSGPSALLMEFTGLSGRHMLLDTPLTFRRILADYEPGETDYSRNLVWVRRRPGGSVPAGDNQLIGSAQIRFNEWVTPPTSSGKLFAQLLIKPNALGLVRQLLWKTPPVYLRLEYENGDKAEYKMLPATASGGVLINYLPRTLEDFADLLAGYAFSKVRRFQLFGPGISAFQQAFEVNWLLDKSPFVDYSNLNLKSPPQVVSVILDSSDGPVKMATVTARDESGYRQLKFIQIIVGEANNTIEACHLRYQLDNRTLSLLDRGDKPVGEDMLGSRQVLDNANCAVNLAESWQEFSGDSVTLHLDLAVKQSANATRRIFARAIDESGAASKLTEFASWKPTGQTHGRPWSFPPTPPSVSLESVKHVGHDKQVLTVLASDVNGVEDVDALELIVNNGDDGRSSCYVRYERKTNTVSLMNDAGTAFSEPIPSGSAKQLSNSFCTIRAPEAPTVKSAYVVSFTIELSLTEKLRNRRSIFLSAVDLGGLRQSWRDYAVLPEAPH